MLSVNLRWITTGLFCTILLFVIYSPSLNSPYLLDDGHTIASNAFVQNFASFPSLWTTGRSYSALPATYGYRPVTTSFNLILWSVADGKTWPFHVVKILLLLGTSLLLFRIWSTLLPHTPSTVVAAGVLLFCCNPVHTQVATYIAAIATQWAALFVSLALYFYLLFRSSKKKQWLLCSLLSALFAILSKEEGVVVVALIPLVEFYLSRPSGFKNFLQTKARVLGLYLLPGVVGVGLIVWMFEPTQNLVRSETTVFSYFMTQWRAYLRYFFMFVYPYDLNADNLEFGFSTRFWDPLVLLSLMANAAVLATCIFLWKKKPEITLAFLWFYIGVSPASSVVVLSEPVNDHRAFIGYLGFGIVTVLCLQKLFDWNRRAFVLVTTFLCLFYSVLTFNRGEAWRTNENFWRDIVKKNPSSPRAANNLGLEMIQQKKYQEALQLLNRCLELQPSYPPCSINRAVTFASLGRDFEAEADFERAVRFDRGVLQSHLNWAQFLNARGQFRRAEELLEKADRFAQGQNLEIRLQWISSLRQQGLSEKASSLVRESLQIFGGHSKLLAESQSLPLD